MLVTENSTWKWANNRRTGEQIVCHHAFARALALPLYICLVNLKSWLIRLNRIRAIELCQVYAFFLLSFPPFNNRACFFFFCHFLTINLQSKKKKTKFVQNKRRYRALKSRDLSLGGPYAKSSRTTANNIITRTIFVTNEEMGGMRGANKTDTYQRSSGRTQN